MDIELLKSNLEISLNKGQQEQFSNFIKLFDIYNAHTNLISKNDAANLFAKHIYDSLCINIFIQKYAINSNSKILDIGTGGGFPSLPIAIAFPELQIYPIDSIAKKIGFIELVQKELRLENIYPICKRVEDLENKYKSSFDIVTSRAVAPLNTLLEYSIPYLKTGGYFVAYKSKTADIEIESSQNALKILNSKLVEKISYTLPLDENYTRELIIIRKEKETPTISPRNQGQAKKTPL